MLAAEAPAGSGAGPQPLSPEALSQGLNAAFPQASVAVGAATLPGPHGLDRAVANEMTIGGENVLVAMVAEGLGASGAVDWCAANLTQTFVRAARGDPSAGSLRRAGKEAFKEAHREVRRLLAAAGPSAPPASACHVTVCAINRLRGEITACNAGASSAVLFASRGAPVSLTEDHRFENSPSERQRMQGLGSSLKRASSHGQPTGVLRTWPPGVAIAQGIICARAIGSFGGSANLISPQPHCSTVPMPPSGGDLLIGTDGLWDELFVSTIGSLCRTCPTPTSCVALTSPSAPTLLSSPLVALPLPHSSCSLSPSRPLWPVP